MSNQHPPGGDDLGPAENGKLAQQGAPAATRSDPNRTMPYTPRRRSIVDRLRAEAPISGPARPETADTLPPYPASPGQAANAGHAAPLGPPRGAAPGAETRRPGPARVAPSPRPPRRLLPFVAMFAVIVLVGLAAGAGTAWVLGWRPGFLAAEAPPPPAENPPEVKAAAPDGPKAPPAAPAAPPGREIAPACLTDVSDVKAGSGACGFALDQAGVLSFGGKPLSERLTAGSATAQRIVLQPLAPSKRYAILAACEAATGGRCPSVFLADISAPKLHPVKSRGDEVMWVSWSPNERAAVVAWRDGPGHGITVVATTGETLKPSAVGTRRHRYALVKPGTIRWQKEDAFVVEVKICNYAAGRQRNEQCETSDKAKFRLRAIRLD